MRDAGLRSSDSLDGYDTFAIVHDAAAVADGTVATGRAFVDVGGRLLTGAAIVGLFGDGLTQLSDPCPEINQTHNFARTCRRICAKTRVRSRSNTFDVS